MHRSSFEARRRRLTYRRLRRPPGVWWAFASGVAAATASTLLVLAPSVSVMAAASGTGPFLRVPLGAITLAVILGYALVAIMIVLCLRVRHTGIAWLCAAVAAIVAACASVYPLVSTAIAVAQDLGGFLPALHDLLLRAGELI